MTSYNAVAVIEHDDPSGEAALAFVRGTLLAHIPDLHGVSLEESHPSEDLTVPGDQRHIFYARFPVSADDPEQAAGAALAVMRQQPGHAEVFGLAIDGDWTAGADLL